MPRQRDHGFVCPVCDEVFHSVEAWKEHQRLEQFYFCDEQTIGGEDASDVERNLHK